mgnify:CR=1 FL=1
MEVYHGPHEPRAVLPALEFLQSPGALRGAGAGAGAGHSTFHGRRGGFATHESVERHAFAVEFATFLCAITVAHDDFYVLQDGRFWLRRRG